MFSSNRIPQRPSLASHGESCDADLQNQAWPPPSRFVRRERISGELGIVGDGVDSSVAASIPDDEFRMILHEVFGDPCFYRG